MTEKSGCEVAVVGAGVVGLCVAYQLAREGRDVVLVDPEAPGAGASFGNAGTIADYAVEPVGTPDVLRNLPSLLFDRNSPLSIRRAALPSLAPWLLRFARQSLPGAARRNALALAALLGDAAPRWRNLASDIGESGHLANRGCLYMFESTRARKAAEGGLARRRDLGVSVDLVSPEELKQLEPGLPPCEGGGAFFSQALFMTDPGRMMARLAAAAEAAGVRMMRARITGITRQTDHVVLTAKAASLSARHAVLAAGAHSKDLARQAGDRVPLETERGYHVEYDMPVAPVTRPVCPTSRGFYICPMHGRLRMAGTVELGGLTAPPSPHRIARIEEGARAIFDNLPAPSRNWMGFRPSMPDSLPVIGFSKGGRDVVHAYGHGHIGLTLAPVTGALVADMIAGRGTSIDVAPYRPDRF
ncbi:MAG: FAD-binding oxidoreductase [Rhodobacteraceae bacterium]|nr:FAD-binding oxidoreductase [Paracoccaceae bacterium]